MEQQKIDRLKEINKCILECDKCTFHQDISKQNLSYRPEAPCFEPNKLKDAQFKVLSVGLNPGPGVKFKTQWKILIKNSIKCR